MPNITGATKFFPRVYENTVAMTLSGTITAGAATVGVNGMTNYSNGDVVCFVVDPSTPSLKQVFTGTISGTNVVNAVWTEFPTGGVNVGHSAGASVVDYVTATDWDLMQKGLLTSLAQDGTMLTAAVQKALNISGGAAGGWTPSGFAPSAVAYNGNHSYNLTFSANDLTPTLSNGMRLQMTRTVAAPTQCTSINGSTQYYSKTSPAGMTFTNNFVVSAWVKLSSYGGSDTVMVSRYNGTSGWRFGLDSSGRVFLSGYNAGSSNQSFILSYQSVPLNKWVHVASQLDMATFTASPTTSYVMLDGVDVPASVARSGSNPTALIQAGNLEIGSTNGGTNLFPGKIAQAAIYSAKVTEATIAASTSQTLAGTETSLISAYTFSNTINDLNANANNLTANGSAVATNADTPFAQTYALTGYTNGVLNYGIVTNISFSTNTTVVVQVPEGDTIPTSGGVSGVSYATNKIPYAFPSQRGKWTVFSLQIATASQGSATNNTWYNVGSHQLNVPIGEWQLSYQSSPWISNTSGSIFFETLATTSSSETNKEFTTEQYLGATTTGLGTVRSRSRPASIAVATSYYLNLMNSSGSSTTLQNVEEGPAIIEAECAYL